MIITWQRGSEVEDRIKFANLVTLKYIILVYPGGPNPMGPSM